MINCFFLKIIKIVTAAAQQNKSANINKHKTLIPFEAISNAIEDNIIIIILDKYTKLKLELIIFFPSTMNKLEIAFIKVSMLLIVKDMAKNTITIEI